MDGIDCAQFYPPESFAAKLPSIFNYGFDGRCTIAQVLAVLDHPLRFEMEYGWSIREGNESRLDIGSGERHPKHACLTNPAIVTDNDENGFIPVPRPFVPFPTSNSSSIFLKTPDLNISFSSPLEPLESRPSVAQQLPMASTDHICL